MVTVIIFEDSGFEVEQWEDFSVEAIKQHCDFEERTSDPDDDDYFTTIQWATPNIASVSFADGPHFIFIKQ